MLELICVLGEICTLRSQRIKISKIKHFNFINSSSSEIHLKLFWPV